MQYVTVFLKVNEVDQFWNKVSDATKQVLENLDELMVELNAKLSDDVSIDVSCQPVEQLNVLVKVVDDDGENRTVDYNVKFLKTIHTCMYNYSITKRLYGTKLIAKIVNYSITKDECCIVFDITQNANDLITKLKHFLKSLLRKQPNQTHKATTEDNEGEISTCFDCVYCYYNPYYDTTGTRGYDCALAKRRIIDDWDWSDSRNPHRLNCRVNSLPTPKWCPLKQSP